MTITDTTTPTRPLRSDNRSSTKAARRITRVLAADLPQLSAGETGEMYGLIDGRQLLCEMVIGD